MGSSVRDSRYHETKRSIKCFSRISRHVICRNVESSRCRFVITDNGKGLDPGGRPGRT